MQRSFDFASIDVVDMLQAMGIRNVTDEGSEAKYSCPFPGHMFGDERPSAYMNTETTAFYCHGCKERGNAVTFITKHFGISPLEALRQLKDRYGDFREPEGGSMVSEFDRFFEAAPLRRQERLLLDDSVLERFPLTDEGRRYMHDRGFTDDILERFEIGFDASSQRVTIPVRDDEGSLVGFKARAIDPQVQPKYMVLGDTHRVRRYGFPAYEASSVVFALDKARGDDLILCEGELNVVAMHRHGFVNAVGISGSELSETQQRLIRSRAESIILIFDSDLAGITGVSKAATALYPYMPVKIVPAHSGDPASLSADEICRLVDEAEVPRELLYGIAQ